MTPAAKVTYLAALLIGLSLGAWFGFTTAMGTLKTYYDARRTTALGALTEFSYVQYRHADAEHAKAALQAVATLSEEMEKLKSDKTQEFNLAIAYTRLALLEDAAHNSEQSHAYMTEARYWRRVGGGRDYSESEMKSWSKTLEDRLQQ